MATADFSAASVAPGLCDCNGGAEVVITGTFTPGRAYAVYPAATNTGAACYSGVSGQGNVCYPQNGTTVSARLPIITPGAVDITVEDSVTGTCVTLANAVRAENPFLDAQVFALRQNVRPILATGPTDPSQMPDPVVVPGYTA